MPHTATAFDTTGDGRVDSYDTNGDGHPDAFDTNGDGYPDAFDTTGDGRVDAYDTNGDGRIDLVTAVAAPHALAIPPRRGGTYMAPVEAAELRQLRLQELRGVPQQSNTAATVAPQPASPPTRTPRQQPPARACTPPGCPRAQQVKHTRPPPLPERFQARQLHEEQQQHKHNTRLLACCTSCNVSVALYALGCVSVIVGTILLIVDGPAPMRVPESGEREEWERDTVETQAFDVPDEYSPDLKYREGTIFGAWWEHLVLAGWICFLVSAIIQRCKHEAGRLDGATKDWSYVATTVAVLCFVVSTCVVLVFTGFSGLGIVDIIDEDDETGNLLQFWELKCDRVVCWVHELVGRILVAAVVCVALCLMFAAVGAAEAAKQEQERKP